MTTKQLITEAISLPVEERALIVDSLLKSLNPTESDNENAWVKKAQFRLQELRSGKVTAVSGDEVINSLWNRFHHFVALQHC